MSRTVLVIEDTELLRRMYADRLESDGFTVVTAANGLEGIAALRVNDPDLILLDLVMPQMSGIEFLEIAKADPRTANTPVLILSNLGQEADINRAMGLGAADYLVKNDSRPADVSDRIKLLLQHAGTGLQTAATQLYIRDHEAGADQLVEDAQLPRRFWCPACEVELVLELVPNSTRAGWYDAHIACPSCHRSF